MPTTSSACGSTTGRASWSSSAASRGSCGTADSTPSASRAPTTRTPTSTDRGPKCRPVSDVDELPDRPNAEIHHQHRDVTGGWLRPTVFGTMDGLVSNFALIAGVAGASATRTSVVLAGLAGLVGGAFSMAAGEYVSVQSQNESTVAELEVERHELVHNPEAELAELAQMYEARGVEPELARQVARQLSRDPDQALLIHAQEELGVDPTQLPKPAVAAISSFVS